MDWRLAGVGIAGFAALACGGVAQESGSNRQAAPGGSGGHSGGSGGAQLGDAGLAGSGVGGAGKPSGGAPDLEIPIPTTGGAPPGIPEGEACIFAPPSCHVRDQYIDLVKDGVRLSYPLDTSCGDCSYKCEVCDELTCSLWAQGTVNCGTVRLSIAACAGLEGQPPCLNSASNAPYYLDASGQRWDVQVFAGSESELPNPASDGPVALEAQLTISNGLQTRVLTARTHVCASFNYTLVVCK
ncbi:MAG TPA: hypothetical protein VER96_01945 [Polyangiaceae bacterium]|nr:hypothetical protein [Polyangiaceae bacterium]